MITDTKDGQTNYCPEGKLLSSEVGELPEIDMPMAKRFAEANQNSNFHRAFLYLYDQVYAENDPAPDGAELDQARRIEELERHNKELIYAARRFLDVSEHNFENGTRYEQLDAAINATPSHSAAWEWNQHIEWVRKNLQVVAYGDRLGSHWQQAYCVPDTGVPNWMEPMVKLVAIPELKEVKE